MITDKIYIDIAYLVAAICFIYGLKMLSHPRTARNGNRIASVGMLIAIIATVYIGTDLNLMKISIAMILIGECMFFTNPHAYNPSV